MILHRSDDQSPSLPVGQPTAVRLRAAPARRKQASAASVIATLAITHWLEAAKQVVTPALQVTRKHRNRAQPLTRRRRPSRI